MTPLVGVSSSVVRHESAQDLLRIAIGLGADCIDLRAGRDQPWEGDFELIAKSLPINFVGVSASLGAGVPESPAPPELMRALIERGIALRVFAEPLDSAEAMRRFADDVMRLRRTWGRGLRLVVEPHKATPTLAQLDVALAEHQLGAVVDTLGLVRVDARLEQARAFLQRHGAAVQVKGLTKRDGDYRHVGLVTPSALTNWVAALLAGSQLSITLESKANTLAEDIRAVRRLLLTPMSPLQVPEEIASCVPAS